jgi:hypothetical protein
MASLNLSSNGPSIKSSYQGVINAPAPPTGSSSTYSQWALFSVQAPLANAFQDSGNKESVLKVQSTGEGELEDLIEDFNDGRIQFAFVKVKDPNTGLPKYTLIAWVSHIHLYPHDSLYGALTTKYSAALVSRSEQKATSQAI